LGNPEFAPDRRVHRSRGQDGVPPITSAARGSVERDRGVFQRNCP
jgi:hypothetical protein